MAAITTHPLVSICIPLYNGSAFIRTAIASCINQTYSNIEIVVVDDGSVDDSIAIVNEFAVSGNKIKVYKNEVNRGLVGNWKRCVQLASGDWIKFLFQDDYMDPTCVEKMINGCLAYNTQFALCARTFIFDVTADQGSVSFLSNELKKPEDIFTGKQYFTPQETIPLISSFLIENVLGEPICTLFHKEMYVAVNGFNENIRQLVDYEFALKIVLNHPFVFINEKLVEFRVHSASATSKNTLPASKKDFQKPVKILSTEGDWLAMLHLYQTDKLFEPLRKYWGDERLALFQQYIYLKACKKCGSKRIQDILKEIMGKSSVLKNYQYKWIKYKWIKHRFKKHVKPYLNAGLPSL